MDTSAVVKWDKFEFQLRDFSSLHANGGRLEKFWVVDRLSNRQFLIKANTFLGWEPISEKLAYIIGKNLGMDVLWYDVVESKVFEPLIGKHPFSRYYSICEKIDRYDCYITSIAEIKRAINITKKDGENDVTNKEVMFKLLSKEYIDKLILFDAIIGNTDRHYGNVHLLRKMDGTFVPAPILDNGASLLAMTNPFKIILPMFNLNETENSSSMIFRNHDDQVMNITTLSNISFNIPVTTIRILNEIEPTLKLINKVRAWKIRNYIIYRMHKYLGSIKQARRNNVRYLEYIAGDEREHT